MTDRLRAILLTGPTGSGKTPLGELLDNEGLRGGRCHHFDFGERLRRVARQGRGRFRPEEVELVRRVLEEGALLEGEHFHVARKILKGFIEEREVAAPDIVVLNGLPRHTGQAEDIDGLVNIRLVVYLSCPTEVVIERIGSDAGGDRSERTDDDLDAVRKRLATFAGRTAPLVAHYRSRGVRVETFEVGVETTPGEIRGRIERLGGW